MDMLSSSKVDANFDGNSDATVTNMGRLVEPNGFHAKMTELVARTQYNIEYCPLYRYVPPISLYLSHIHIR